MTPQDFMTLMIPGAVAIQRKYGLPATAMVAQAALETGWGTGTIYQRTGNIFSIKGVGPAGSVKFNDAWEVVDGRNEYVSAVFRAYHNPEESFEDYAKLITSEARYQPALLVTDNPLAYLAALHSGGYATDPGYVDKLASIIDYNDIGGKVIAYVASNQSQPTEPQIVGEIPEWMRDGAQYLADSGLIDRTYGWENKLLEPMPVWATMNLFARVFRYIDNLRIESKIVEGDGK